MIANPCVDEDGNFSGMIDYPDSGKFKSTQELLDAPFLDGNRFIEFFQELKFFD